MAYPYIISTGYNLKVYNFSNIGPFEYSGNRYVVAMKDTFASDTLHMFKSTNLGVTWAEQDAADAPERRQGTGIEENCSGVIYSGVIYISYGDEATELLRIARFDCATDQWLSSWFYSGIGGPTMNIASGYTDGGGFTSHIVRRSTDGSFVVMYQGAYEVVGPRTRDRIWYVVVDSSGNFGSSTMLFDGGVARDYSATGMVELTDGRIIAYAMGWTDSYGNVNLYAKVIKSDNSMSPGAGSAFIAASNPRLVLGIAIRTPIRVGDEAWIAVGFDSLPPRIIACDSADSPTFYTQSTISVAANNSYPAIVAVGSTVLAVDLFGSLNLRVTVHSGGSWGAQQVIATLPGDYSQGEFYFPRMMPLTGKYAIVTNTYDEYTGIGGYYLEYDLPAAAGGRRNRAWIS